MPESFRYTIAHLSDLHLTASDTAWRSEPGIFGRLRGMNEAFRQIVATPKIQSADLVLVTGDVTDRGDLDAWRFFWEVVNEAGLADRLRVVPGNHDLCCLSMRLFTARHKRQKGDLRKAAAGLRLCGQETRFPWGFRPNEHVALFGLNSNNLGNRTVAENAMGQIGYYQLGAFADLLHKHRDAAVKIVALHHSPNIPRVETALKRGQKPMGAMERWLHEIPREQRRALLLLCRTHRVRLVLHGHLHGIEDRRVGGVRIIGAPAATEPANGRGEYPLHLYRIRSAGSRLQCRVTKLPAAQQR